MIAACAVASISKGIALLIARIQQPTSLVEILKSLWGKNLPTMYSAVEALNKNPGGSRDVAYQNYQNGPQIQN